MNVLDGPMILVEGGRPGVDGDKGDKGDPGDGATTLTPRIDALESINSVNRIYVSATGAGDLSGSSEANAIDSWQGVLDSMIAGIYNIIYIIGEVELDWYRVITNPPSKMAINKFQDNSILVLKNAANIATHCGFWIGGSGCSIFINCPVRLDSTSSFGLFNTDIVGDYGVYLTGGAPTQTPENTAYLFAAANGGQINTVIAASPLSNISGRAFKGVAAGANPNDHSLYKSNVNAG